MAVIPSESTCNSAGASRTSASATADRSPFGKTSCALGETTNWTRDPRVPDQPDHEEAVPRRERPHPPGHRRGLDEGPCRRHDATLFGSRDRGFVSEHDGNLHAVSGVCTHMGCLLRVNAEAGRLDCPCHGTAFDLDGTVVFSQLTPAPPSLVKIGVRRTGDRIEVLVPPDPAAAGETRHV